MGGPEHRRAARLRIRALRLAFAFAAFSALLASAFAAPAAAPVDPLPALDEKWRHYRSPNFELYSCGDDKESRSFLWHLELLRAVFFDRFKLPERTRLDLTLYHFSKLEHYTAYGALPRTAAFYHPFPDRAIIAIAPTVSREQGQASALHEYVHHLFRATDQEPMLWFNEGVAELLETIRVEKGKLEVGRSSPHILSHLLSQQLLPFETIFAIDPRNSLYRGHAAGRSMFYAQSWAFLHYLHFGQTDLPREGVNRFVRVVGDAKKAASTDLRQLFRECLGMDYEEMQRRLKHYVFNGKYRVGFQAVPLLPAPESFAVRPVPRDEARLRLAELAIRTRRSAPARHLLVEAAAQTPAEPRLHEVLGAAALLIDRDSASARDHWEKALALGSQNIAVERALGLLETDQWLKGADYDFRLPPDVAARLRERLRRSIAAVPAQSAAYETLAMVEAFSAEPNVANVNLIQERFGQLKEKQRTLLAFALVRARLEKFDEAKALLSELALLPPDPAVAKIADSIRARLESPAPTGRTSK